MTTTEKSATEAPEVRAAAAESDARANAVLTGKAPNQGPEKPDSPIEYGDTETKITFRGQVFRIPAMRADYPTLAMQAFQRRKNVDAVEILIGPRQWQVLNDVAPTLGEFGEFLDLLVAAAGFSQDT